MKEFKHGETVQVKDNKDWYCRVYIGTYRDRHVVGNTRGSTYTCNDDRIREESPSSVDVEIDWSKGGAWIDSESIAFDGDLSQYTIGGSISNGWVLSGYLIDGHDEVYREPILFNTNGTEIESKVTHARFVKIN